MLKNVFTLLLTAGCLGHGLTQSPTTIDEQMKAKLREAQTRMFNSFCNADIPVFKSLAGEDYLTINADGTYMGIQQTLEMLPRFKGATYVVSEQTDRFYDNLAISTGKAKFYLKSFLAAEVYFTQIWALRNGTWTYIGWQGTMTGLPSYYPVIFTAIGLLALYGAFLLIRRLAFKKR